MSEMNGTLFKYVKEANSRNISPFSAFQKLAEEKKFPLSVGFELTHHCNFHCKMCYMHTDAEHAASLGRELTADEWISLARQVKELGAIGIAFTGGEVFTRSDFKYIYETIYDMGFWVSILTNASLITENEIEWLKKRKPYSIAITLYGCSPEVYENTCRNAKGYETTMKALDLLYEGDFNVYLKSISLEENYFDREKIKALAESRGWRYNNTAVLEASRKDTGECFYRDSIDHDGKQYPLNAKWYPETSDEFHLKIWESLKTAREKNLAHYKEREGFVCTAGRSRCWITWYGKMQACAALSTPVTQPLVEGFSSAWERLKREVSLLGNPDECLECIWFPICRQCPATHYTDTGKYNCVSKRICNECQLAFMRVGSIQEEGNCSVEEEVF